MSLANRVTEHLHGATFGFPIKHSVSPSIHRHVADVLGIPWTFTHGEYATLDEMLAHVGQRDFAMGAVTMPFKETIMAHLDHVDADARAIGAVNTLSVVLDDDGRRQVHGYNTDAAGIARVFCESDVLRRIPQRIGMVVGSGGAARAAVWALVMELQCTSVCVVARSEAAVATMIASMSAAAKARNVPLAETVFHVKTVRHAERLVRQGQTPSLAVCCVPETGRSESPMHAVLDVLLTGRLHRRQVEATPCILIDMCFKPLFTTMMQLAEQDGWTVVGGIEVLGAQLIEQWRIWLGGGQSAKFNAIPQADIRKKMREMAASNPALQGTITRSPSLSSSLPRLPQGIMSASLGSAEVHDIESKIKAAHAEGFDGIEVFYECLRVAALTLAGKAVAQQPTDDELCQGARHIRRLCDQHRLSVIALQPWIHYVGLRDKQERDRRVHDVLPVWFALCDILGTDTIQVPSQMFKGIASGDAEDVVGDLKRIAEAGWYGRKQQGRPTIRFAYEAMAFGAWTSRWQDAWEEVEAVDMPNFGIVLDTFQILGECWADPTSPTGTRYDCDARTQDSLHDLRRTFAGHLARQAANRQKLFYVQIGDAQRMDPVLSTDSPLFDVSLHANAKMAWNRACRNFAYEGYLPLLPLLKVLFDDIGYRGTVSAEVMSVEMRSSDATLPMRAAQRAQVAWHRCVNSLLQV